MVADFDYTGFHVEAPLDARGLLPYDAVVSTARAVAERYPDWRLVVHTDDVIGPQLARHGFRGPTEHLWHICQPAELHAPADAVQAYFEVSGVSFHLYPGRASDGDDLFERVVPALDVLRQRGYNFWDSDVAEWRAEYAEFSGRWGGA